MGETNAILERRKGLTTKKFIDVVEKFYFENFSDTKFEVGAASISATFELIFLYGKK